MEDKKSYYAIIPASVRYDKNLTDKSKLLYGEITALCNEKGFCWASNEYFAKLYETSTKTIVRCVSLLLKNSYIICNYRQAGIKKERCITLANTMDKNVLDGQKCIEQRTKMPETADKNVPYNNTVNNTVNIFSDLWDMYPKKKGKGQVSTSKIKLINEIGLDEMTRAIERYQKEIKAKGTDEQYIMYGSTFFNSGYVDYLDANYEDKTKPQSTFDIYGRL